MTTLERISDYLQNGRSAKVQDTVRHALEEKIPPRMILEKGLLDGMRIVAEKFKLDEVFVPQVLVASRAINAGLQIIKQFLNVENTEVPGIVVIGTVKGDMHDIGKNIVCIMMESKGLKVVDLASTFLRNNISMPPSSKSGYRLLLSPPDGDDGGNAPRGGSI
jgi:methanogenic corrinoid protein MtbC1